MVVKMLTFTKIQSVSLMGEIQSPYQAKTAHHWHQTELIAL